MLSNTNGLSNYWQKVKVIDWTLGQNWRGCFYSEKMQNQVSGSSSILGRKIIIGFVQFVLLPSCFLSFQFAIQCFNFPVTRLISLSFTSLFSSTSLRGKSFEQEWSKIITLFTQIREVPFGIDWLVYEFTFRPSVIFPLATAVFVDFPFWVCLPILTKKREY